MRTTVTLSDALYEEAKVAAARRHTTVGSILEDALSAYLARVEEAQRTELPELPVAHGGSVLPGVDINDGSALIEMFDEGRPLDSLR